MKGTAIKRGFIYIVLSKQRLEHSVNFDLLMPILSFMLKK